MAKDNVATMLLTRTIILHSPVSNQDLLAGFVEQCLAQEVSLLAIHGPGCQELEEAIDWLVIGDASDPGRFFCTSSHPDEPYEELLNMVKAWDGGRGQTVQEVRL